MRALAHSPVQAILLDRNNYHMFSPLLYQVAAAEVSAGDIVYPVRSIVRRIRNAEFCLAAVQRVDFVQRTVVTDHATIPFDYLILATGSVTNFYGVAGASLHAFLLKDVDQGLALRNHILRRFEYAMHAKDPEAQRRMLTFVIVGGGPTGVEFAGALAELIRGPLVKDYRHMDLTTVKVVLLEATNTLLADLPERLRTYAKTRLQRMGVDVRLRANVQRITSTEVFLSDGTVVPTETAVWTAGVRGDPLVKEWGVTTARNGRVEVLPTLQLAHHPNVYVVGDLALGMKDGQPLPMIAPVAIQQGVHAARNVARQIAGREPVPFRYRDPGAMVTIGRNAAVARLGKLSMTGFPAWLTWLSVHLAKLIGFRNRILVLINWAWDYFLYERAVRLILPNIEPPHMRRPENTAGNAGGVEHEPVGARTTAIAHPE
jgi:NADH dehydrogenase